MPGRATYTWGVTTPPADIAAQPPVSLELALLTVDDTTPKLEWPLILLDQTQYEAGIVLKGLDSSYPNTVYLEASQPVARLHLWPVPSLPYTLQLLPYAAHAPYEHWDHALAWPPGYERAFAFGLAVDLAPQYGVEASPTVQRVADEAKRALYVANAHVGRLALPARRGAGGGGGLTYPRGFREGWG